MQTKMKQYQKLTLMLCGIWAVSLLYGEMFAFWVPSLWACSWPHLRLFPNPSINSTMNEVASTKYLKVVVLADPQLMDRTSLPLPPKSLALEIAQFYADLYMRRAFLTSILSYRPDVIVFLGDYFDGGPYLSDEEWQESLHRYRHIFGLNAKERYADIQVYYIPGNHDIGYESINSRLPKVVRRYEGDFGIRNYRFEVGKVEFVSVDAQTLDGNPQGILTSTAWEFVENVSKDLLNSRVLLSHIPLYRPDNTNCGPHRNSPIINQRISRSAQSQEITYQNYITEESSNNLMDMLKPVLILSGHDHDQCTVTHEFKFGRVMEHTLGTLSWQQGNLYPSFMILSASNSKITNASIPKEAVMTQLCFLPWQTHIYMWYLSLFALTVLILLVWPTNGLNLEHHLSGLMASVRLFSSMLREEKKEKNEDEDCEYEMMWDAEGSMHLVKKPRCSLPRSTDKTLLSSRGNAVMRPVSKKYNSLDIEVSLNTEQNADVGLAHRIGKSKTKIITQRLLRTFRMLTLIAAVNIPLYMMLLFKDWID